MGTPILVYTCSTEDYLLIYKRLLPASPSINSLEIRPSSYAAHDLDRDAVSTPVVSEQRDGHSVSSTAAESAFFGERMYKT